MILRASDGLRARASGPWTADKLFYVERYAQAFTRAMAPKREQGKWDALVYIDLLAGPGLCIDEESKAEFDGSALRALKITPSFDHLYLSDLSRRNVADLKRRIPEEDRGRVSCETGDCNLLARKIVSDLPSKSLGVVFLDPEGFEIHFKTLEILATRRLDILYLFPSGIGIPRNLARFLRRGSNTMDNFWGGRNWQDIPPAKVAAGRTPTPDDLQSLASPWVLAFRNKVAKLGLAYTDDSAPLFTNRTKVPLYHLLFFSHDPAGLTIWRGIKRIEPSGQRSLPW